MYFEYRPSGVCSALYKIEISDDNKIDDLTVIGGCNGNLQGISKLVKGMDVNEVIDKLSGIRCGFKPTSCPDQISKALKSYLAQKGE